MLAVRIASAPSRDSTTPGSEQSEIHGTEEKCWSMQIGMKPYVIADHCFGESTRRGRVKVRSESMNVAAVGRQFGNQQDEYRRYELDAVARFGHPEHSHNRHVPDSDA